MNRLTRRNLIFTSHLWAAAAPALAQTTQAPSNARKQSQMTLTVTDLKRSLDFYQGLFGMAVQARQGAAVLLRVGSGPQYLALKEGSKAGYSYYGLAVEGFNAI